MISLKASFLICFLAVSTCTAAQSVSSDKANDAKEAQRPRELKAPPDQVVLSVARLGCYWGCKEYRIDIEATGKVTFTGKSRTRIVGEATTSIDHHKALSLIKAALEANVLSAAPYYTFTDHIHSSRDGQLTITRSHISDQETTEIALKVGNFTKSVRLYEQVPSELSRLVQLVELTTNVTQWVHGAYRFDREESQWPYLQNAIRQLDDPDAKVRAEAAARFQKYAVYEMLIPLSKALADPSHLVREAAAKTLANEYSLPPSDPAFQAASEALIHALQDSSRQVRDRATVALGYWNGPKVVKALVSALREQDVGIQVQATKSLARLNQLDSGAEAISEVIQTADRYFQVAAAKELAEFGLLPQSVVVNQKQRLLNALSQESAFMMVLSLGANADVTVPEIDQILSTDAASVSENACKALLAINTHSARRVLRKHAIQCSSAILSDRPKDWIQLLPKP